MGVCLGSVARWPVFLHGLGWPVLESAAKAFPWCPPLRRAGVLACGWGLAMRWECDRLRSSVQSPHLVGRCRVA